MYEKQIAEIKAEKLEIRTQVDKANGVELSALEAKLNALEAEEKNIEARSRIMAGLGSGTQEFRTLENPTVGKEQATKEEKLASKEYRNAYIKNLQNKTLTNAEQNIWESVNEKRFVTASSQAVIPTITLDLVTQRLIIYSALYPKVEKYAIKGNLKIPKEDVTEDPIWHTEGAPQASASDTVDYVTLTGYELVKIVSISRAQEDLSIDAFESFIVDKLAKKIYQTIEKAIVNGAGAVEPFGIIPSITWNAGNYTQYTKMANLDYSVFTTVKSLLSAPYHANAMFAMNNVTLWSGVANVLDALGRPIFMASPAVTNLSGNDANNYLVNPEVGKLLGSPVVMTPYLADGEILFGDFKYYAFNMARDIMIEKSYESSFISNMIDFKATLTGDGNVILPEAFVRASF